MNTFPPPTRETARIAEKNQNQENQQMKHKTEIKVASAPGMNLMMSVEEASEFTGYTPYTVRVLCRTAAFTAEKPRGNKGGWQILRPSLEKWWAAKRRATTNTYQGGVKI